MKDYSQLYINKDDKFLNRMKFDVYKRQSKNERIKKLIEQNKIKINEVQRIKAFNRLIEYANRIIEAEENIKNLQGKLSLNLVAPSHKNIIIINGIIFIRMDLKKLKKIQKIKQKKIEKKKKKKIKKLKKKNKIYLKLKKFLKSKLKIFL